MQHLGTIIKSSKYGFKLNRDNYAIINKRNSLFCSPKLKLINAYEDENGKYYTDEWCNKYCKLCLINFDINMAYFKSLDLNEFNEAKYKFLSNNPKFVKVDNLNDYELIGGYYVMVLEEYKQMYIGTSYNIKKRIQQHWTKNKPLDRLLLPMYNVKKSIMSIDSFRCLDTTELYVYPTSKTFSKEDNFINQIDGKFLLNRLSGGKLADIIAKDPLLAHAIRIR